VVITPDIPQIQKPTSFNNNNNNNNNNNHDNIYNAVMHFDTAAHTGDSICSAVNDILAEYNLPEQVTPVTILTMGRILLLS